MSLEFELGTLCNESGGLTNCAIPVSSYFMLEQ